MHIHKRLVIVALALLAVVPLSAIEMTASLTDKHKAAEELDVAMKEAEGVYASGRGLFYQRDTAAAKLNEISEVLELAQRKKSVARRVYILVERELSQLEEEYDIDLSGTGAIVASVKEDEETVSAFLRYIRNRGYFLAGSAPDLGVMIAQNLVYSSLGEMTDSHIRMQAVAQARVQILERVLLAKELAERSGELENIYEEQMAEYEKVWQEYLAAKKTHDSVVNRIAEVQRVTEEVESQIAALQRELARIDAKLVAKLERELIEKGLMSAQPGERSDGRVRSTQTFRWPVSGRISAGFHNAAYKNFFGVAHKGIDIVVPQERQSLQQQMVWCTWRVMADSTGIATCSSDIETATQHSTVT